MTKIEKAVYDAVMKWHHSLTVGGVGADYHKYCAAFNRLFKACVVAKKAKKAKKAKGRK